MTEYQYDPIGRVRKVYDNGKVLASYDYNADNTIRKIRFANGITTEYTYDKDKNKASIKTVTAEGNVLMDYHYEYDRNGNLTARIGGVGLTRPDKTSYTYDSLQRISNVTYGDGVSESFTYDQVGNRIKRTLKDREEVYNYDTRNRLLDRTIHDLINPQDSHITTYEYDKQGNTLREVTRYLDKNDDVINTKIYEYNAFQKVSKITVASANQAEVQENFYDPEGLRYGVRENGRYTGFITNGWYVLGEIDEEWNIRKRLVRGHDIVASEDYDKVSDTSAYHFYHQNEHYDMELITGHDGRIRNSYSYDVFGNLRTSEEGIENRYTYYGEQYDKVSEQYYLRARYYNPAIARFTQEDEYRGDGLNLYAYCANNPIMYVDPSGYSDKPCTGKKQNDDAPDNNGGPNNGTPNNEGGL